MGRSQWMSRLREEELTRALSRDSDPCIFVGPDGRAEERTHSLHNQSTTIVISRELPEKLNQKPGSLTLRRTVGANLLQMVVHWLRGADRTNREILSDHQLEGGSSIRK